MFREIGPMEIILILAVLVLLFGAKKLPDLARGSGRALRIFKAETRGLMDDDDNPDEAPKPAELPTTNKANSDTSNASEPQRHNIAD